MLSALYNLLILTGKYYHYSYIVDEDVEVQRGRVTDAKLHNRQMPELGFDSGLLAAKTLVQWSESP